MKRLKLLITPKRRKSFLLCVLSDALFMILEELTPKEYIKGEIVNVVLNWFQGLDPIKNLITFASSLIN